MTVTGDLSHHPLTIALGWTLLHLFWQGALMALTLAGALLALRRSSASLRYLVCCAALAALAACPFVTFALLTGGAGTGRASLPAAVASAFTAGTARLAISVPQPVPPAVLASWPRRIGPATEPLLSILPVVWCVGVMLMSLRLLGGWIGVRRLQSRSTLPITGELQVRCAAIARQMGITRAVELLESAVIETPCTFGWLRAVVLLPASALSGLSPLALEALLAHELAHIRRYDYLVNLLQTTLETLLFYHPATWWISRQIRLEREHCCDDLAVVVLGDAKGYARALAALEGCRQEALSPALGAADGELLSRIRRVLTSTPSQAGPTSAGSAVMIVLVLFIAIVSALSLPAAYRRGTAAAQSAKRTVRHTFVATVMDLLGVDRATATRIAFGERHADRKAASWARPIVTKAPPPSTADAPRAAGAYGRRAQGQSASVRIHVVQPHLTAALSIGPPVPGASRVTLPALRVRPVVLMAEPPQPATPTFVEAVSSSAQKALVEAKVQLKSAVNVDRGQTVSPLIGPDGAAVITASYAPDSADAAIRDSNDNFEPNEAQSAGAVQRRDEETRDIARALKEASRTMDETMHMADEQIRQALANVPPGLREARRAVERAQQQIRQAQRQSRKALEMARRSTTP